MKLSLAHLPELGAFPWRWQLHDRAGNLLAGGYEASEAEAILSATVTKGALK